MTLARWKTDRSPAHELTHFASPRRFIPGLDLPIPTGYITNGLIKANSEAFGLG